MNLYEISGSLIELLNMIDENEGEYSDDCLLDTWEDLDGAFEDKIESWCKCIKNIDCEVLAIKEEIKRLQARQKQKEDTILRMKSIMAESMAKVEKPKIKTGLFNVNRLKLNGKLVVVAKDVPKELRKEQISLVPDNDMIRQALENGEKLSFARFYNSITIM